MARAIPAARLVFLVESGHQPMLEEPDRFNQVVLDFLLR
jgi:pimeloyl-ACP methyl ester carboxylesterase